MSKVTSWKSPFASQPCANCGHACALDAAICPQCGCSLQSPEEPLKSGPPPRKSVSKLPLYTAKNSFGFIGLSLLAWSLYLIIGNVVLLSAALRAPGTVITILGSGGDNHSAHPLVNFKTATGKEFDIIGNGLSSYEVGDRVEVLYYPDSPQDGRINSFKQLWGLPFIIFLPGALFTYATFGPTEKFLRVMARGFGVKVK